MSEITVDGLRICYTDEGSGKVVILLHGWGANKESLGVIADRLKQSFRVICPDLPGAGASDEPEHSWDVSDYSAFLRTFLQQLDVTPFAALGHSNGGRILIRSASDWFSPEKLILLDSAGIKRKHGPVYYAKVYGYKAGKKVLKLPPFKNTGLYEKLIAKAGSADYRNSSPVMKATMSRLLSEDLTGRLSAIRAETLLIWGECDTATPIGDARIMEKKIPGAGLVTIAGAGHFSYLDNFTKAYGAIDYFLHH